MRSNGEKIASMSTVIFYSVRLYLSLDSSGGALLRCSDDTFCFAGQSGTEPYSSTTCNRAGVTPVELYARGISVRESKSTMWYDFPN